MLKFLIHLVAAEGVIFVIYQSVTLLTTVCHLASLTECYPLWGRQRTTQSKHCLREVPWREHRPGGAFAKGQGYWGKLSPILKTIQPIYPSQVQPRCDLCEIQVSSEVVLQTHLAGKSHQKKLRHAESQAKMSDVNAASLSQSEFTKLLASPVSSSSLVCDVCKITTNSPQQMDFHLTGMYYEESR